MITGPRTPNQITKRLYRNVFDGLIGFYFELFLFMEENAILGPFKAVDIATLHFTFIPNKKLDAWRHTWWKHILQTIKTSPLRLWVAGQINGPLDGMSEDQLLTDEKQIITSPTDNILTQIVRTHLNAEAPFESKSEN